ncbi:MAG: hypothetical protein WA144_15410 [Candidatus Methanoperedens sp.]
MTGEITDGLMTGETIDGQTPQAYIVATEAEKPTNPGVGDTCRVLTTTKEYTCFVTNVWSLVSSPVYEEYSNHLGTVDNILLIDITGTGANATDAANHEMDLSSGIGAGTAKYYISRAIYASLSYFEFNCIVKNIVSGIGGTRLFQIGLVGNAGVRFQKVDDGSWVCNSNNGVAQKNTTIADIVSGDILSIKNYAGTTLFYVNGVLVATHTTIPTIDGSVFGAYILSTAATTTAREISIDYIGWRIYK